MARNGFRVFDADTHVGPAAEILDKYLSDSERRKLVPWEAYKWTDPQIGNVMYIRGRRKYLRRLGAAKPEEDKPKTSRFSGALKNERVPLSDNDPAERIRDMDIEGVDVALMLPSSWFGTFTVGDDVELESAMYRAYHRWMADYCGAYPQRLKGVLAVCVRDLKEGLKEIERCSKEDWPLAALVYAPTGYPLDHPDLEPLWAACQHHDFSVVLHPFTTTPPYAAGGLDVYDNHWILRCTSQTWSAMRDTAALLGAGVMDRYPNLRLAPLEAGHSWLPFWMARMDEFSRSHAKGLPPLKKKPSEYVLSGRYFQSIEMSEGEKLTKSMIDLLGEDLLMYASDFPHLESWFPESVDTVMAWDLPERAKRKLFWDNAVKYYARFNVD